MLELADDRPALLSTLPPDARQARLARGAVLVSALVFVALVPLATVQLAPVWPFIPTYQSALAVNDVVTAVLLYGQYAIVGSRALLVLAAGYLFTAAMAAAHMLTFPGLFAPTGLLGAGMQTTAWMYMFWHAGFPVAIIAYTALGPSPSRGRLASAIARSVAGALALAAAFTALATAGQALLPAIMVGQRYTPAMIFVVTAVWAFSGGALVALWRKRSRTLLDLWLMVVMCAWLFDIALAAVLNHGRFDVGFYAGRVYGLLAASFVLVVLLLENGALYAQLARSHERERQRSTDLERLNDRLEAVNARLDDSNRKLQQASRFKSEFLAHMSHELRTPLNAIIGFSELLEDDAATVPRQRRFAGLIFDGAQHLLALLNDVLDLSKVEAGRMTLEPEGADIARLLRDCLAMFEEAAKHRGVRLHDAGEAGGRLLLDVRKLRQVIYNLLSNAVKFSPDGGTVVLGARRVGRGDIALDVPGMAFRVLPLPASDTDDWLEIRVSDRGPGVGEDELALLFEPFRQARSAAAVQAPGTGLGLALVSRLAALHGGTVGVASAPGQGSVFAVWIPWRDAGREAAAELPLAPPGVHARRALVVEDDAHAAELLRAHLESAGFEVAWVSDAAGIRQAAQPVPDVITLDILLHGESGWDVLEQLKRDPVLGAVPVVIVSVLADEHKGVALGAAKVLQKPLTRAALLEAVAATTEAASARKVLVIDDDPLAVELVATNLDERCEVARAHDGAQALASAIAAPPDLIILDLMMPGMSGFEVVDAVRREPSIAAVPIIVMTAKTVTAEDRARLNGRVQQVVSKSHLDRSGFLSEVERALHERAN